MNVKVFSRITHLLLFAGLTAFTALAQQNDGVTFYRGVDPHPLATLNKQRLFFVEIPGLLGALDIPFQDPERALFEIRVNQRSLVFDLERQHAVYLAKVVPVGLIEQNGVWYLRAQDATQVFSDLLGQRMIFDADTKTLHLPRQDRLTVRLRLRKMAKEYQLLLDYSQRVPQPRVERTGGFLTVKIPKSPIDIDATAFEPNEAVLGMEPFGNLPDGTTEILFRLSPAVTGHKVGAYNPKTPRTVVQLRGDFVELPSEFAEPPRIGLRRIVIDPGHGGRDKGAVGPTGLEEKELNLDLAFRLKRLLERHYNYEVLLTRQEDATLSLKARTGIANNFKADLFVSIHHNAVKGMQARGSEIFYLSLDGHSDVDTSHYNSDENDENVEEEAPPVSAEDDDDLSLMLWDLAQNTHVEDSFRVARYIQQELNDLAGIKSRGVKQAPLKVLKGAKMPAVLVEAAFLSNPKVEKLLKTAEFRERIVASVAKAIGLYDQDVQRRAQNTLGMPQGDVQ